ncbi:MAG: sugar transferase [Verrucomicrobia bacterium]|nr:sugar transferase [Verrucomicrobiota bacterium]
MLKRIFDICFSIGAMIFFFPLCLGIAIAIKLDSPGPLFYGSLRVGRNGKPFLCWKFRTMYANADMKLKELLQKNSAMRQEWELFYKLKDDPRITKIGKFLRRTSLDELPQFWNIFMGDLSVVGPRPVTQDEIVKYFGDKAQKILSVRPGLTGIWQTSGRSLLTFEERIKLEESYIDQQSLSLDLRIIFKTIPMLVFSKGAY